MSIVRNTSWMLAAVLCLSFVAHAADEENPFKNAKVGDWVKYKQAVNAGGMKMETELKQTVSAKDEKEVTVDLEMTMNGNTNKTQFKIPLDKKYEPYKQPGMDAEVKELAKGEEKVTVNGKSLDTKWVEVEVAMKVQGNEMKSKSKVWTSPAVPVGGLVKMEAEMMGGKTSMELQDYGNGK